MRLTIVAATISVWYSSSYKTVAAQSNNASNTSNVTAVSCKHNPCKNGGTCTNMYIAPRARTGVCNTITDAAQCCKTYDSTPTSNCVPADSLFSNGKKCESKTWANANAQGGVSLTCPGEGEDFKCSCPASHRGAHCQLEKVCNEIGPPANGSLGNCKASGVLKHSKWCKGSCDQGYDETYVSRGCLSTPSSRTEHGGSFTVATCRSKCKAYQYFGLHSGKTCWCSNDISDVKGTTNSTACGACPSPNKWKMCGNLNANTSSSVYFDAALVSCSEGTLEHENWKTGTRQVVCSPRTCFSQQSSIPVSGANSKTVQCAKGITGAQCAFKCGTLNGKAYYETGAHICQPNGKFSGGRCESKKVPSIHVPASISKQTSPFGSKIITFQISNFGAAPLALSTISASSNAWSVAYYDSPSEQPGSVTALQPYSSRNVNVKVTPAGVCCGFAKQYVTSISVASDDTTQKVAVTNVSLQIFEANIVVFTLPGYFTLAGLAPGRVKQQSLVLYNVYS